jgi:hypothetical protein
VTEQEYDDWFRSMGFERTGEGTKLTEEWINAGGTAIMVTRASELSLRDRLASIERFRRTLGIGFPIGGGGVH